MHSGSKKANRLFGYDMGPASDVQTPIVDPIVRKSTKLFFFFETIGISHRVSPPASFSRQYTTSFSMLTVRNGRGACARQARGWG